ELTACQQKRHEKTEAPRTVHQHEYTARESKIPVRALEKGRNRNKYLFLLPRQIGQFQSIQQIRRRRSGIAGALILTHDRLVNLLSMNRNFARRFDPDSHLILGDRENGDLDFITNHQGLSGLSSEDK